MDIFELLLSISAKGVSSLKKKLLSFVDKYMCRLLVSYFNGPWINDWITFFGKWFALISSMYNVGSFFIGKWVVFMHAKYR